MPNSIPNLKWCPHSDLLRIKNVWILILHIYGERSVLESPRKQGKVLIVDNELDINMSFKLTLENAGSIVDVYNDPLIALSKFKPSYYDLVILDIKMPK